MVNASLSRQNIVCCVSNVLPQKCLLLVPRNLYGMNSTPTIHSTQIT
jgi:hypothetical protein